MILCIAAGGFTKLLAVTYHIQDIVLDLKCNADIVGTQLQCRDLLVRGTCQGGADGHCRLDQGCCFVGMNKKDLLRSQGRRLFLCLNICVLSADHAVDSRLTG